METKTKTNAITKAFEKELNLTETGFEQLKEKKSGLIIDASTDKGFKELRKERTEQNQILKNIDRLAIDGKTDIDEVRQSLKDRIIKIYLPSVEAFDAEDLKRKAAAKELAEKEEARIKNIKDEINGIRLFALNIHGKTSEEIADIIEAIDLIDVSESFAELTQEAITVKKETLGELNLALSTAIQNEQLEADRVKLNNQELKLKAQERLNKLMMIPTTMFGKTSEEIESMISKVDHTPIIESQFGELYEQAKSSVETVKKQLGTMLAQTKFMEDQSPKQEGALHETIEESIKEDSVEVRLASRFNDKKHIDFDFIDKSYNQMLRTFEEKQVMEYFFGDEGMTNLCIDENETEYNIEIIVRRVSVIN